MGFAVEISCPATGALNRVLCDLVGERAVHPTGASTVLSVVDQSAVVALVARLNDLGLPIERVERLHDTRSTGA